MRQRHQEKQMVISDFASIQRHAWLRSFLSGVDFHLQYSLSDESKTFFRHITVNKAVQRARRMPKFTNPQHTVLFD